jgi:hypothetical protein
MAGRRKGRRARRVASSPRGSGASRRTLLVVVGLVAAAALVVVLLRSGAGPFGRGGPRSPAHAPSLHSSDRLAVTIDRAAAFLSTRPLTADSYWLARRAGFVLAGEFLAWGDALTLLQDQVEGLVRTGYRAESVIAWLENPAVAGAPLRRLPQPVGLPSLATARAMSAREVQRTIDVTLKGFNNLPACAPEDLQALLAELRKPATGYVLTHQLFALMLPHHHGCTVSPSDFEALRELLAVQVLRELLGDERFTDLTAERMAVLALAGLSHWIPEQTIAKAIATQGRDGSWPAIPVFEGPSFVEVEKGHQGALALFGLAEVWKERERSRRPAGSP